MKKLLFAVATLLLLTELSQAQYGASHNITGMQGGTTLRYPWAGGLNNPQFSSADLDHDGLNDLVVFDRTGFKVLTFRNNGGTYPNNFDYAPEYELNFPVMDSWCLLMDFNCDNVPDIFTHTVLGIRAFKGFYNTDNKLAFTLYDPLLKYQSSSGSLNLLVTSVDIPAFVDMNNDGDVDVLTFDPNGGYMWYFENVSQENGWGCDSLSYIHAEKCWGDLYEPSDNNCKLLDEPCPFMLPLESDNETRGSGYRHAGSTTLAFDNTGDGIKEALVGDISFNELSYLLNDGTLDDSHVFDQDCSFPSYNVPSEIPTFPAAFRLDVDNDGKLDLLASPNAESASNMSACVWFYKNTGTNSIATFQFQTDSFLVNHMFDVGEGCHPVWFDYDNDGLTDLLLANYRYYDTCSYVATIKNIGSQTTPAFQLTKRNYANLASLNKTGLHPTFGDIDGDNDQDMIVGNEDGTLLYFENTASIGSPALFTLTQSNYFGIDVGGNSAPQLFDLNNDGKLDLIIGKANGKLSYYENSGSTTNPNFSVLTTTVLGGVGNGSTSLDASSVPCFTQLPGFNGVVLLAGNKNGNVQLYSDIEGNLTGEFTLETDNYSGLSGGKRSAIDAKDINGDGVVELAIGNYRGGVTLYDTASFFTNITSNIKSSNTLTAFPNPTTQQLFLRNSNYHQGDFTIVTYDAMGRKVALIFKRLDENTLVADVSQLTAGIYFSQSVDGASAFSCRWIKTE